MFTDISLGDRPFYEEFGECFTRGIQADVVDRPKIAELLRFCTLHSGGERISLKEYVERMCEGQTNMYYSSEKGIAPAFFRCFSR